MHLPQKVLRETDLLFFNCISFLSAYLILSLQKYKVSLYVLLQIGVWLSMQHFQRVRNGESGQNLGTGFHELLRIQ